MKINGKLIVFVAGFFMIVLIGYFVKSNLIKNKEILPRKEKKISVVTTLFPLYDFARVIGDDKVEVSLLLPPGVEPHSFEPKPNDILKINQADLFIYTGKFMEPWVEDLIKGITNKNLKIVDASQGIKLIPAVFHHEHHQHEDIHHENDEHHKETIDPHIWLDFDNAKIMVESITKALIEKDLTNKAFYEKNEQKYKEKLTKLDQIYQSTLSSCKSKKIVYGGHYAFGYLAKRYGLIYLAAQGISPDAEPTANDLMTLVNQIKTNNIKYIYYEKLTSPKIAEILAKETNTKMLLLNAAHNLSRDDFERGTTFISILEENLKNLAIGLECK